MKIKNYFTIALASLAMVACNKQEVEGPDEPGNGGFTPGVATYATFSFKLGDKNSLRSSSNAGGGAKEDAVNKEDEIASATIYLFEWEGNEAGRSDVMLEVTGSTADGGAFDVPSKPVMTTAGKKHLVIVTNMSPTTKAKLNNAFGTKGKLTGYDEFYKAMMDVTANQATNPATEFVTGAAATTNVTMIGESDPIIEAGVSETDAAIAGSKNHISVFVDRAVAKLDLKLQGTTAADYVTSKDVMATTLGTTNAAKVGQISNVKYDVRNMNRKQYYLQHTKGADFVVTPESHQLPTYWTEGPKGTAFKAFYPSLTAGTAGSFTHNAAAAAADVAGAGYRNFVAYVTENTNETAAVGNSSYTAMKTTYNPMKANYVSGFTNAGVSKVVTLTEVAGTVDIVGTGTVEVGGAFSLFNQEYNLAFKGEAKKDDAKKLDYFRTMAAYHTSRIEPSLVDISNDKIVFVKAGVLSANTDAAVIDFGAAFKVAESITSTGNIAAICAGLKTLNQGPKLVVLVKETINTAGDLELITLQAAYFWKPDANVDEFAHNGGVNFGTLTAGIYNVEDKGLTNYYRVNIFDAERSATHQLRYSVIRNYSYHVNVTKVNKIGFPTDFDVTVDPETPLNNNTFLQAHVTINKWVKKQMDTELGQ